MTAESEHRHVLQPTRNERYTVQRRQCLYADRHLRGRSLRGCQFLSSASANAPASCCRAISPRSLTPSWSFCCPFWTEPPTPLRGLLGSGYRLLHRGRAEALETLITEARREWKRSSGASTRRAVARCTRHREQQSTDPRPVCWVTDKNPREYRGRPITVYTGRIMKDHATLQCDGCALRLCITN